MNTELDRTFAALADPTRRALLTRLGEVESLSVSELAKPLPMSLPGAMKHLDILVEAGLVERQKVGRTVSCRLNALPMKTALAWLEHYERFWSESLDRLAAYLERDDDECPQPPSPSPASRSTANSKPRQSGSSRPGRTPPK